MTTAEIDSTTKKTDSTTGDLYWYRHLGWMDGTQDWKHQQLVNSGGWQQYKSVFATNDGVIYAIDFNGDLWWYRDNNWQNGDSHSWSGRNLVGKGGWDAYKLVFATSSGVIYAIDKDGNLWWYRHEGWQDGTQKWLGRKLVSRDWPMYSRAFATTKGILYGITSYGELYWHHHIGWVDGSDYWARKLRVATGWQRYTSVFATNNGVIYGIAPDNAYGNLYWYHHKGWQIGAEDWEGPNLVGSGGWLTYTQVFMTDDGVIFGVH